MENPLIDNNGSWSSPLTDMEKEQYSCILGLESVEQLIETIIANPRPRRFAREKIADNITMMKRINVLTGRELFSLQSLDVATRLKESINNDISQYISKAERAKLFEDLRLLYFTLKDVIDPSISGGDVDDLRRLLTPPYRLFDHNGHLQPRLGKGLIDAGAKAVMVTEDHGSVVIVVEGPDPETDFLRNFRNMGLTAPTIKYTQCEWSPEGGGEEADIVNGTIGALVSLTE